LQYLAPYLHFFFFSELFKLFRVWLLEGHGVTRAVRLRDQRSLVLGRDDLPLKFSACLFIYCHRKTFHLRLKIPTERLQIFDATLSASLDHELSASASKMETERKGDTTARRVLHHFHEKKTNLCDVENTLILYV
jgi:hypothetical protein